MERQRRNPPLPTIDITSVFDLFAFLPIFAPMSRTELWIVRAGLLLSPGRAPIGGSIQLRYGHERGDPEFPANSTNFPSNPTYLPQQIRLFPTQTFRAFRHVFLENSTLIGTHY